MSTNMEKIHTHAPTQTQMTKMILEFCVTVEVNKSVSENLISCELLSYTQNYFDKSPKDNIIASVSTLYGMGEIDAASRSR